MKNLTFIIAILAFSLNSYGQTSKLDSIFIKNTTVIIGKVLEIGTSEVKYVQPQINEEVVYIIGKDEIERIVFFNGNEQQFNTEPKKFATVESNSEELFKVQKKNALKVDFLSIAANTLALTYERSLKPGRSIEFSTGIIGIGTALKEEDASGILFRGGYKLTKSPDFYINEMRYSHILKGSYVKFEFDFASYDVTGSMNFFDDEERYGNTKWALLIVLGKQWVFGDNFLIDIYSGFGLGDNSIEDLDLTYPYGFLTLGDNFPLAFSLGMRLGFLIK